MAKKHTLTHTHTHTERHCIVCCVGSEVSQIECAALTELWQLVWPTDTVAPKASPLSQILAIAGREVGSYADAAGRDHKQASAWYIVDWSLSLLSNLAANLLYGEIEEGSEKSEGEEEGKEKEVGRER